jgi:tetratricopeptide (TPR) repeat protein
LPHYCKPLEELNKKLEVSLLITNDERALSENEAERRFDNINLLSKNVADNPNFVKGLLLRAIDYYLVQDMEAAMTDLDNALLLDSTSWELFFIRSFVRYRLLETEQMGEGHNSILLKQDTRLPSLDYRLVKEDLDKVVALQPEFVYAYFNRANVSAKLNDFKSAIVDYSRAISLNDRFAQAYYNRGLAKIYTGNTEGGIADLSKAGELGIYQAYSVIKRFR